MGFAPGSHAEAKFECPRRRKQGKPTATWVVGSGRSDHGCGAAHRGGTTGAQLVALASHAVWLCT